jgi:nucleotidyltransferase AbiEii toxin of type IV toxin-antitoxin system
VEVDLLAGEYEGTGRSHRTQRVQDVRPRKARGCDLAFEMCTEVFVEGSLPGGARDSAHVRVASVVPFFVMKAMALHDRLKPKDAWDLYFCLQHYPGGLDALVEEFRPHIEHGLVREGLQKIAKKFASAEHAGPGFVADFEDLTDPEDRELRQRDAYERMDILLTRLGIR